MSHLPPRHVHHSIIGSTGQGAAPASHAHARAAAMLGMPAAASMLAAQRPEFDAAPRRRKLAELDGHTHCSIIGTCLGTAELRKLVTPYAPTLDRLRSSDLDVHHTAVELSMAGGDVTKLLNKALDARHANAIKKAKALSDDQELGTHWSAALVAGDIAGAYWALLTHPDASFELRSKAFGDIHMLSHKVGASNRADLRRLATLEQDNLELKQQNEHQQARLFELSAQHALAIGELEQQLIAARSAGIRPAAGPVEMAAELDKLRSMAAANEQKLALHTRRREDAEQRLVAQAASIAALVGERTRLEEVGDTMRDELDALEQLVTGLMGEGDPHAERAAWLNGKRVLYVGGRPAVTAVLSSLVAKAGGELILHDGGVEDRQRQLDAILPRAQLVVFPVDCVSHNAMHNIKRLCERHAIPYYPVRSASVASVVELLDRLACKVDAHRCTASHFCLRHG